MCMPGYIPSDKCKVIESCLEMSIFFSTSMVTIFFGCAVIFFLLFWLFGNANDYAWLHPPIDKCEVIER